MSYITFHSIIYIFRILISTIITYVGLLNINYEARKLNMVYHFLLESNSTQGQLGSDRRTRTFPSN